MARKKRVDNTQPVYVQDGAEPDGYLKGTPDRPQKSSLLASYWREVDRYNGAMSKWREAGETIESIYLSEIESSGRRYALLWSNVETVKPAVYGKVPTVLCTRRYKDKNTVARTAAELMERAANTSFDLYGAHSTFKMVTTDRLLPGRGTAWVRYHATIQRDETTVKVIDGETGEETEQTEVHEKVTAEKVCADYVHWTMFGHNVGRGWKDDVWLVWRIVFMTHDMALDRFGAKKAASLKYDVAGPAAEAGARPSDSDVTDNCCAVYEFWDKKRGSWSFAAQGQHDFLEEPSDPPVNFRDFFPCPEPCYATKSTKQLVPVPDYHYYRDQAREINELTVRIHNMTQWLIVKGFVPGGPSSVADPIEEAIAEKNADELFIQVESMKEWSDRGGVKGMVDWLPTDVVAKVLESAIRTRGVLIADVYQLVGISDLLRGMTNPNETFGAQELKAQTGARRLKDTKDEIARFCKDIAQLTCEVIAEQFSPESIAKITGYKYVPTPAMPRMMLGGPQMMGGMQGQPMPMGGPQQMPGQMMGHPMGHNMGPGMDGPDDELTFGDDVMALLRDDQMRSFTIDVETDQTNQADENLEKQRRMELLKVVGESIKGMAEAGSLSPHLASVAKETFLFTVRAFRVGKAMEETLERSFEAAIKEAQQARQAQAQQPNPEMIKAQQEIALKQETAKAELTIDANRAQAETQLAAQKQQSDAALKNRQLMIDAALKARHNEQAATAQARDRALQLLGSMPKSGTLQ